MIPDGSRVRLASSPEDYITREWKEFARKYNNTIFVSNTTNLPGVYEIRPADGSMMLIRSFEQEFVFINEEDLSMAIREDDVVQNETILL